MKFKLLRGSHQQSEPTNEPCVPCGGLTKTQDGARCVHCRGTGEGRKQVTYSAHGNNIVDSSLDLEAKFGYEKFQRLEKLQDSSEMDALRRQLDKAQSELAALRKNPKVNEGHLEPDLDLNSMTMRELVKFAGDYEIELEAGLKKDEMVNIIQQSLDAR